MDIELLIFRSLFIICILLIIRAIISGTMEEYNKIKNGVYDERNN